MSFVAAAKKVSADGLSASKPRGAWASWVYGDPSKGIIGAKDRYPAEYDDYFSKLNNKRGADINFASEAAATFGKADWEAHQAMYPAAAPVSPAPRRLKHTEQEILDNREARRAATVNRNRLKIEALKAEKEAAKSAKASAAGIPKLKAKTTFGKADYEALAEEYAEPEEGSPVAAAATPALPVLPAPASTAPAPALPVAALIEHIDTIQAEVGAIRSLLMGLRGGSQSQKQKRKQKQTQKTRRLRK
jgi:hypothetical protein